MSHYDDERVKFNAKDDDVIVTAPMPSPLELRVLELRVLELEERIAKLVEEQGGD